MFHTHTGESVHLNALGTNLSILVILGRDGNKQLPPLLNKATSLAVASRIAGSNCTFSTLCTARIP
jgi:hypothetical protein